MSAGVSLSNRAEICLTFTPRRSSPSCHKCGANGIWLIPSDVLRANLPANQIPIDLETMQRRKQIGIGVDDRNRDDAPIRAASFAAIVFQHHMQDHIVVTRIPVVRRDAARHWS